MSRPARVPNPAVTQPAPGHEPHRERQRPRRSRTLGMIGLILVAVLGLGALVATIWLGADLTEVGDAGQQGLMLPGSFASIGCVVAATIGWALCLVATISGRGRLLGVIGLGLGVLVAIAWPIATYVSMIAHGF